MAVVFRPVLFQEWFAESVVVAALCLVKDPLPVTAGVVVGVALFT